MKINNIFKYVTCTILILYVCISAVSCSKNNADYSFENKDGQSCIVFDDISQYVIDTNNRPGRKRLSMSFSSLKEFKDTVTNGKLTDEQKSHIATMFKKENDVVLTCDFNNLYDAKLPPNISAGYISWSGEYYSIDLVFNSKLYGYLSYYKPSHFKYFFENDYETFFDRDLIHVTETKDLGNGKTATYYYTEFGKFVKVRYSLDAGGKTIIVDKQYTLEIDWDDMRVSSTIPSCIELYCDEGDKGWTVSIYDPPKDPTDEWLIQFGLTPYVETDAVVK